MATSGSGRATRRALPNLGSIPDFLYRSDHPGWDGGYGHFESIGANYNLINDNLFDITHAEYVHPESFGGEEMRIYRNAKPGDGLRGSADDLDRDRARHRVPDALAQHGDGRAVLPLDGGHLACGRDSYPGSDRPRHGSAAGARRRSRRSC